LIKVNKDKTSLQLKSVTAERKARKENRRNLPHCPKIHGNNKLWPAYYHQKAKLRWVSNQFFGLKTIVRVLLLQQK
jgi:hypothetical protein